MSTNDVLLFDSASLPWTTHSIVLENLSHPFSKPNILDIKLGTVLYDESASEEKRARMIKTAKETTSFETGVRLTGFQVMCKSSEYYHGLCQTPSDRFTI